MLCSVFSLQDNADNCSGVYNNNNNYRRKMLICLTPVNFVTICQLQFVRTWLKSEYIRVHNISENIENYEAK